MKLTLLGVFNSGEENYLKIRVNDKRGMTTLKAIKTFLADLKLNPFFQTDSPEEKQSYMSEIGRHTFTSNDKYTLHAICAEDSVYLVMKCQEKDRQELMAAALRHFQFSGLKK